MKNPTVLLHYHDAVIRVAIRSMDEVDTRTLFEKRTAVMKAMPRFLKGPFRSAFGIGTSHQEHDEVDWERGWNLFNVATDASPQGW